MSNEFEELLDQTRELVQQAANKKRGTITVSPEVAAMLGRIDAPSSAPGPVAPTSGQEPAATAPPPAATAEGPGRPAPRATSRPKLAIPAPADPDPAAVAELEALEKKVNTCTLCRLHETRTNAVFGDGHLNADLVFVGEAPGATEDAQGKPFVGRAGKLLTDIIEKGMQTTRNDVYIGNVLKCRPPGNRDPRPDERELCEPYLVRQLELLRPKVICALGAYAAKTLLKTEISIGRLRGKWHFYHGTPLRVTYHPAYLLRSPGEKRKCWEDVQAVMRLLAGEESPEPPEAEPSAPENLNLFD